MTKAEDAEQISERARVRRRAERARYDREIAYEVLDRSLLCRIGFEHDGQPHVQPTLVARRGDTLLFHGAHTNRMFGLMCAGAPLCVEATVIDGLVMGRSVYMHSVNFRSTTIFGRGVEILDRDAKNDAMIVLMEHVFPGRHTQLRPLSNPELAGTRVIALEIEECSTKVRVGPPDDVESDLTSDAWAGVLPLQIGTGEPLPDPHVAPGAEVPEHIVHWGRDRCWGV